MNLFRSPKIKDNGSWRMIKIGKIFAIGGSADPYMVCDNSFHLKTNNELSQLANKRQRRIDATSLLKRRGITVSPRSHFEICQNHGKVACPICMRPRRLDLALKT